jgi:hypothetical protein
MDLGTRQYTHESMAHFVEPHSEQPGVIMVYKIYQYLSLGTHLNGYTAKQRQWLHNVTQHTRLAYALQIWYMPS